MGTKGLSSQEADLKTVKDMESFSIAIDGNVQNWNPMDMKGWSRALNLLFH